MKSLVLFNNVETFKNTMEKMIPNEFGGKKDLIKRGVDTFDSLDELCSLLVPGEKDLNIYTKRSSVNRFLDSRNDEIIKVIEKDSLGSEIQKLKSDLANLDFNEETMSLFQKFGIKIKHDMTKKELINKVMKAGSVNIDTFCDLIIVMLEQSKKRERDVKKIKDSVFSLTQNELSRTEVGRVLNDFIDSLELKLIDYSRFHSKHDKLINDINLYRDSLKSFEKFVMRELV